MIRNENSKMHSNISSLRICHKLFLTGTPIQNSLNELFTLLQLIDADKFPSREEFNAKYKQSVAMAASHSYSSSRISSFLPASTADSISSFRYLSSTVLRFFIAPPVQSATEWFCVRRAIFTVSCSCSCSDE